MFETLLATKFFIPSTRPELVSRPRLVNQLNTGFHRKLTLISAPAGFGKTTLVTEWLGAINDDRTPPVSIAWLSLDRGDNDPTRFLTYFVAALNQINGLNSHGKGTLTMLESLQPPPVEALLTPLINEIAASSGQIAFILDDYHLIDDQAIHEILGFLIENQPPQIHLILTTREDPQLPLARLRAKDQLTELRAADLRFTPAEAAEFLNEIMGLTLSKEDIAALETRTEGWITGLQLAAISMQRRKDVSSFVKSFTGSHKLVLDYLIEEVLSQQPENIQIFLLQTSILDRLTGPLCETLTNQDHGQQILETLERANLFIVPQDDQRHWYRYHQLFADLLRERLHRLHPEWSSLLHQKASTWFEQHGFDDEAIEHALMGDDYEHAAEIIDQHIDDIWGAGQHAVIQRWVANLPDALVFSKPHLCIFHAWYLFVNGQREAAKRALEAAEQAIKSDRTTRTDSGVSSDKKRSQGRVAAIQAFMDSYSGDLACTIQNARTANEYLPRKDLAWRCLTGFVLGDALLYKGEMAEAYLVRQDTVDISKQSGHYYLILIANLRLAETLRYQGKLRQVTALCKQQMQFINENGISQTVAAGWLFALWGDVLAEKNDMEQAIQQAQKGVEVAGQGRRDVSFFAWSNLYLLRVLFSQGDMNGAEKIVEKMQKILQQRDLPILAQNLLSAWHLRICVHQNKLALADQWVKERDLNPEDELSFFNECEYLAFARFLQLQGKPGGALELLQRLLKEAESGGRTLRVLEILILQAISFQEEGNMKSALETLEKALKLAQPEGFIRIFVDEGLPMEKLLKKWKTEDEKLKIFTAELLGAYGTRKLPEQPLIEPLSERELDVLELIAEGFTNSEIASRLYLALNTVKVHTRNIYQKLGVNNRTQAVARAREIGIFPSS